MEKFGKFNLKGNKNQPSFFIGDNIPHHTFKYRLFRKVGMEALRLDLCLFLLSRRLKIRKKALAALGLESLIQGTFKRKGRICIITDGA